MVGFWKIFLNNFRPRAISDIVQRERLQKAAVENGSRFGRRLAALRRYPLRAP
jgi:hypothetical protein